MVLEEMKELYKTTNDSTINKNYLININGIDYDNTNVVFGTFSVTEKLCSSAQLRFGECNASMLKVKMVAGIGDVTAKKLKLVQTVNDYSMDIGVFNIDSCVLTENKEYRDIVAYDNIILFSKDVSAWYNGLTFPITINDMLTSLCEYVGAELADITLINGDIEVEQTISPEDLKGVIVLKSIAELNGGFFRAAVDGKIEFVLLDTSDVDEILEVSHYKSLKTEDFETNLITKLVIRSEEDDIGASAGDGDNAYIIQDNFLLYGSSTEKLQGIAEKIFEVVQNISYIPYTAEQIGLPYLRCGQQIAYNLANGEQFVGLVLQRTLSGTQALKDVIKTTGTQSTAATYGVEADTIKLKYRINRLKRTLEVTNLLIEDLEKNLSNEITQTSNELNALVKKVATMGDMGVTNIKIMYVISDSASEAPTEGWSDAAPEWVDGKYIWQKTVTTYNNGETYESNAICITGATGAAGADGKDGAAGAQGPQGEKGDKGDKGDTGATGVAGKDGATGAQGPQGEKGDKGDKGDTGATGATGAAGKDGLTIKSIVPEYYLSTSKTALLGGSWTTTTPTWSIGKYVWTRSKITYSDNTYSYSQAVCDASWEVANAIQAELSLKVDEDKLISIINAAADVIKLTSNRLVIDSTYFSLDENGRAELAGGKVGNWEIGEALSSIAEAYVAPGEYERARVEQKILGTATLSTAETQYLDVTGDGNINISDLVTIQKILLGMTEYEDCNNPQKSEVAVEINPTTPNKLIKMAATTPWGRKKESYLGINGIKFPTICGECVTGDTIETTSGANLDELNSNLNWNISTGANTNVYYNRTHMRIRLIKTSFSLSAGSSDKTTFLLPSNINANVDMYFQAMALSVGWQPINAVIYCTVLAGSNVVQIRTSTTLSNNVLLADVQFPCGFFTIT